MGQNTNQFSGLINIIKSSAMEENFKVIAVREFQNQFIYGEMMNGLIEKPFQLNVTDNNSFCQDLHDVLVCEFGEQLYSGYSHNVAGIYKYFMTLGDNIRIYFPDGYEYQKWIYNQIQKDKEKYKTKKIKKV